MSPLLSGLACFSPQKSGSVLALLPFFKDNFACDLSLLFVFEISLLHAADQIQKAQWAYCKRIVKRSTTYFTDQINFSMLRNIIS